MKYSLSVCGQRREEVCYGPWVVGARIERRGGRRERRRGEGEEEEGGGGGRGRKRGEVEEEEKWKGRERVGERGGGERENRRGEEEEGGGGERKPYFRRSGVICAAAMTLWWPDKAPNKW